MDNSNLEIGVKYPYLNSIIQGDCRDHMPHLPADSIDACITDPPYNYEFVGKDWQSAEIDRRLKRARAPQSSTLVRNIPYGSGLAGGVRNWRWYERSRENILSYQDWCASWARDMFRICKPGAAVLCFNSTRTVAHVQVALEQAGFYARDILVYRRSSGIPKGYNAEQQLKAKHPEHARTWRGWHSCLRGEWEAIVVVQKPLKNNYTETLVEYGVGLFHASNDDGSFASNILEGFSRDRASASDVHCTQKPLALMKRLVQLFVPENADAVVIDPFAGSGTTLVACKELGRGFIGFDIVQKYVEIAERRLTQTNFTPTSAKLAGKDVTARSLPEVSSHVEAC